MYKSLYVQVTVHRDCLRINNQQDASRIQNSIPSRLGWRLAVSQQRDRRQNYSFTNAIVFPRVTNQ
jgi:hypothetical protein